MKSRRNVQAELDMANILVALPDEIQTKFAECKPEDRKDVMNAYLNWHLANLPDNLRQEVIMEGGDNYRKFLKLKAALTGLLQEL